MNGFLIYAAKRFLQFLFVVFTGITLAFLIAHFSPVDPIEQTVSLLTSFGSTDPQAVEILRESLRELYGTGGPLLEQYFTFWGRVLTGDFGPSLSSFPTPVMTVIGRALPWTVGLLTLATIISWIIGNFLGALAGYFRSSKLLKVAGIVIMGEEYARDDAKPGEAGKQRALPQEWQTKQPEKADRQEHITGDLEGNGPERPVGFDRKKGAPMPLAHGLADAAGDLRRLADRPAGCRLRPARRRAEGIDRHDRRRFRRFAVALQYRRAVLLGVALRQDRP